MLLPFSWLSGEPLGLSEYPFCDIFHREVDVHPIITSLSYRAKPSMSDIYPLTWFLLSLLFIAMLPNNVCNQNTNMAIYECTCYFCPLLDRFLCDD
jgi:hypothetical protein